MEWDRGKGGLCEVVSSIEGRGVGPEMESLVRL